jgi:hypothetical protein
MIIDLQRRLAEAGRIRIGQQVASGNGRKRPEKLTTFRLTSGDRTRIEQAAQLYGGTPQQWDAPAGPQWEVVTAADSLNVIVPPADMSFSQHYELWSGGGCQRRCDGRSESISDGPCLCDPDKRECNIHTRLSVMLRDLPGLGVWRIDTSGYYAAVELQGAVEVVQLAAGRGQMLPARLRLEQRMVKRVGQGTRRFAVPVLDVEVSPGQLMAGGAPNAPVMVEQGTGRVLEFPVERPAITPVPESVPVHPVGDIAEQAAEVAEPKPRRRNSAQPVPQTGLRPRTVAQANTKELPHRSPPDQSEGHPQRLDHDPEPLSQESSDLSEVSIGEDIVEAVQLVTAPQLKKLSILLREQGFDTPESKHGFTSAAINREIASAKELTKDEASKVIEILASGTNISNDRGVKS